MSQKSNLHPFLHHVTLTQINNVDQFIIVLCKVGDIKYAYLNKGHWSSATILLVLLRGAGQ